MSAEVRTSKAVFTAMTRDLSEGGAGLNCDRPLDEGDEITVGLFLVLDDVEADTPPLWAKARVMWARPGDGNHRHQDESCEQQPPVNVAELLHRMIPG